MANRRLDIVEELRHTLSAVSDSECEAFAGFFNHGARYFFAGAGRSGFAVRGFAMRVMHMEYTAFFVGEPTTPSIQKGDVLVIASGSGNTASLVAMAQKAKKIGASVLLLTIDPSSQIGAIADAVIRIPAPSPKVEGETGFVSIQPMGSLAEQTMSILFDSLVIQLMEKDKLSSEQMFLNHANLE